MSQVKQGLTSVVNVTLPSQLIRQNHRMAGRDSLLSASTAKVREETKQVAVTTTGAETGDKSAENNTDSDDNDEGNAIDEVLVGKGLGNCLNVLRKRGVLGKGIVRGRNMDRTLESQLQSFDKTPNAASTTNGDKQPQS